MNAVSPAVPISWMGQMFGWLRAAALRASRSRLAPAPPVEPERGHLIADAFLRPRRRRLDRAPEFLQRRALRSAQLREIAVDRHRTSTPFVTNRGSAS